MPVAGGKLIESRTTRYSTRPYKVEIVRLWLVDVYSTAEPMLADEFCVHVVRGPVMPVLGDHVSCLGETVVFGELGTRLVRVGASTSAPGPVGEE